MINSKKKLLVNDIHSGLNETKVKTIFYPKSIKNIQKIIHNALKQRLPISVTGGRHAMGGQQFGGGVILVDMKRMQKVINFNYSKRTVKVEAGIQWPELINFLLKVQKGRTKQWGIVQKQTGTATLSIGGTISANAHGRRLTEKPFIDQVESFVLIDATGRIIECSRKKNKKLFGLVIGGYGLFGIIAQVTLRLCPRVKVERVVKIVPLKNLLSELNKFIKNGVLYADYQYSIDKSSDNFLREGILPYYRPVPITTQLSQKPIKFSMEEWRGLYYLAHVNGREAYERYCKFYLSTSGQVYWSDVSDLTDYIKHYHEKVDRQLGLKHKSSEMITEVYVPKNKLVRFMENVRADFLKFDVSLIYGVIRLIKKDSESFLAWAKKDYACIIFNLHVDHTAQGIEKAKVNFRRIIERTIQYEGSFYLTYHRWATREQIEYCYPQFVDFLKLKLKYDPQEIFQSDWYRHYKEMFGDKLETCSRTI